MNSNPTCGLYTSKTNWDPAGHKQVRLKERRSSDIFGSKWLQKWFLVKQAPILTLKWFRCCWEEKFSYDSHSQNTLTHFLTKKTPFVATYIQEKSTPEPSSSNVLQLEDCQLFSSVTISCFIQQSSSSGTSSTLKGGIHKANEEKKLNGMYCNICIC